MANIYILLGEVAERGATTIDIKWAHARRGFMAAVCAAGTLVAGCAPLPGQNTGTYIPQRSGFDSSGCVASACGDSGN
jgi:hypothetical protein